MVNYLMSLDKKTITNLIDSILDKSSKKWEYRILYYMTFG